MAIRILTEDLIIYHSSPDKKMYILLHFIFPVSHVAMFVYELQYIFVHVLVYFHIQPGACLMKKQCSLTDTVTSP